MTRKSVAWIILIAAAMMPTVVFAQSGSAPGGFGNVLVNTAYQTKFSYPLSVGSYVIGVGLAMWGMMKLKAWVDGQVPITDGIMRIVGGALMIALPDFLGDVIGSYFGAWGQGDSSQYNRVSGLTTNYGNGGGWQTLDQVMVNFIVDIYQPAKLVTSWAAYCVGIGCFATGIYRLALSGQGTRGSVPSGKGTVAYIAGGAMMLSAAQFMDAITTTLFGTDNPGQFTSLYYQPGVADTTAVNDVVQATFAFIEIIGWIAFIRGIYLLVKLAQGGGDRSHSHAFTHIVFGAAAVNMYEIVKVIQSSLGIQIVT